MNGHKVMGFCAMNRYEKRIFCKDKTHLVIFSSEQAVQNIAESSGFVVESTKKMRFSDVLDILRKDKISCLFDKSSYSRFFPLALKEGISNLPILDEGTEIYEISADE